MNSQRLPGVGHPRRDAPFVEAYDTPLGIYEDLFASVYDEVVFKQWCSRRCSWQLRLIGPPGSGKTTLAALIIRHLKSRFRLRNVQTASIFLRDDSRWDDDELLRGIMISILCQLSDESLPSLSHAKLLEPSSNASTWPKSLSSCDIGAISEKLHHRIGSLEQAFLVIDDVDICSQSLFNKLDDQLSILQAQGLNIMVTSRIPLHHDISEATCDVDNEHVDATIYWCCKTCHGEVYTFDEDEDGDGPFIICQLCRDAGSVCSVCQTGDLLYEPYTCVNLWLRGLLSSRPLDFAAFVAQALEVAHGDLGIDSKIKHKPPPSALGRILTTAQAVRVVDRICEEAKCNIAIAKLRLDMHQEAHAIEDLEKIGDRLPDNIWAVFDAAIDRVMRQAATERKLGLHAIVAATLDDDDKTFKIPQSFKQLEARLRSRGLLELEPAGIAHHNLNLVLRATRGLLWIDNGDEALIMPYHRLFGTYVVDNCHDALYKARLALRESMQL